MAINFILIAAASNSSQINPRRGIDFIFVSSGNKTAFVVVVVVVVVVIVKNEWIKIIGGLLLFACSCKQQHSYWKYILYV